MTPETQELVLDSLDAGLAQQIGQLFDVLMSAPPDEDGIARFMAGLNKAVGLHTRLRDVLELEAIPRPSGADALPEPS